MKTIWKYPVPLEVEFWIDMPSDAQVLHLGMQRRNPYLWVLVEPENPLETVAFMITGTGHDVPEAERGVPPDLPTRTRAVRARHGDARGGGRGPGGRAQGTGRVRVRDADAG